MQHIKEKVCSLHFKIHRIALLHMLVEPNSMESVNLCGGVFRCRGRALTGCHKLYSLLPFSASFCRLRAARAFLNHMCRKRGGVEREKGRMEREGGMERLSEEDFPVCVCVAFHW